MENVTSIRNEIKTIAAAAEGSPLVKLVAVLMANGITKTAELAAICQVTPRAIQLAKKRTPVREQGFAKANVDSPKRERGFAKTQAEQSPPIRNLPTVDSYPYYFSEKGSLVVDDQVKAKWRPRFDSDDDLDLAIQQVAPFLIDGPVHIAKFDGRMAYAVRHRKPLSTPKAASREVPMFRAQPVRRGLTPDQLARELGAC